MFYDLTEVPSSSSASAFSSSTVWKDSAISDSPLDIDLLAHLQTTKDKQGRDGEEGARTYSCGLLA